MTKYHLMPQFILDCDNCKFFHNGHYWQINFKFDGNEYQARGSTFGSAIEAAEKQGQQLLEQKVLNGRC